MDFQAIVNQVLSHAAASGLFERVAGHEPKSAPRNGLSCAAWVDSIAPYPGGSGMGSTTLRVAISVRLYTSMLAEPPDAIDPNLTAATVALMDLYSGDFELGGQVRNIDLLGAAGPPMAAQAGYLDQDNKLFRVFTITLPLIVNDVLTQGA